VEEIKEWTIVDDHRRRVILQNATQRRAFALARIVTDNPPTT
jgi:predicted Fe-S protein YdhL (DUF1289 family)